MLFFYRTLSCIFVFTLVALIFISFMLYLFMFRNITLVCCFVFKLITFISSSFMFTLLVKIKTNFSSIIVITLITLIFTIFLMLSVTTLAVILYRIGLFETLFCVLLPSVECVWLNNIFNALFLQENIHHQFLPCSQEDIQLLLSMSLD